MTRPDTRVAGSSADAESAADMAHAQVPTLLERRVLLTRRCSERSSLFDRRRVGASVQLNAVSEYAPARAASMT